ncbi:glycosyltransferase family 2 protein [Candidatus Woesebacteria bacterium]|nr:glycosyltransferase family 2 protein [Candidatus Woesebacteria bacterium]
MAQQRAIIIIPTYNERENISKMIPSLQEVFKLVPHWDMHVLVVDDSSPDETGKVVKEFERTFDNVHLLSNKKKQGLGLAYLLGMRYAFDSLGADIIFEFDADFSHDPKRIPDFIAAIDSGADLVLGSRYIKGGSIPDDWGFDRKFLSVVGNLVNTVVLTHFAIRDWTTGYRAIRKSVFMAVEAEMADQQFTGYTFQIGFLHKAVRRGFKVVEVPIQFVDRKIGKSKLGPDYIKHALLYILTARYKEIIVSRLFKFGVVGGIGFIINFSLLFILSRINTVYALAETISTLPFLGFVNASGLASAIGAEFAIISNFILNNSWTFQDRQSTDAISTLLKFLQFNVSSFAAVAIQLLVVSIGTGLTGQTSLSKTAWLVCATAIGMVVNYTIYSKVIWRSAKK